MIKIAINGFGRIGRAAFKVALAHSEHVQVVAINDLTDTQTLAHLLKYDSNYGVYQHEVSPTGDAIMVDGIKYPIINEKDPLKLPWADYKVDIVLECTGRFRTAAQAEAHISAGAKRVIISAPADEATTVVRGSNSNADWSDTKIISNASCTTNSLVPVMMVLDENFGIEKSLMSTIHSYTADQTLVDGPHKDLRRARSAAMNIIPTSTGAAIAVSEVMPHLKGLFDGLSFRVPTPVVSVSDITFVAKYETTIEAVNKALSEASKEKRFQGILKVTNDPVVSMDIKGDSASAVVDLSLTQVVGGNLVKVVVWYDNEWGYSNRLVELAMDLMKD